MEELNLRRQMAISQAQASSIFCEFRDQNGRD
jgi:hypothetical protein